MNFMSKLVLGSKKISMKKKSQSLLKEFSEVKNKNALSMVRYLKKILGKRLFFFCPFR